MVHYPGYQQFPVPGVQFTGTQVTYTAAVYTGNAHSSSVPPLPPTCQDDSTNTNSSQAEVDILLVVRLKARAAILQ